MQCKTRLSCMSNNWRMFIYTMSKDTLWLRLVSWIKANKTCFFASGEGWNLYKIAWCMHLLNVSYCLECLLVFGFYFKSKWIEMNLKVYCVWINKGKFVIKQNLKVICTLPKALPWRIMLQLSSRDETSRLMR